MPSTHSQNPRAPDGTIDADRFVALAFAGANLVVECNPEGVIGYAAGSFRTEFAQPPEAFIGCHLRDLAAHADHEAIEEGLWLLRERGRLLPMTIRLSGVRRTQLALAGLVLPGRLGPQRLCLTFAPLPTPASSVLATMRSLARATEARLRAGSGGEFSLLEISGLADDAAAGIAVGTALQAVAPDALAGRIAPGKFGLLAVPGADLLKVVGMLERVLRGQGDNICVTSSPLSLTVDGLTGVQAARALRQALTVFARSGSAGFAEAGFAEGLAGYLQKASVHVNALRRAIQSGRFDMAYQPVVSLADGTLHHYEALIRPLPVPECHLDGPQEFILLVETLGLADEVDLVVARKACDAAAATGAAIAFNLSGQSAQSSGFRTRLLDLLQGHAAWKAGLISVELTETADIEDVAEAALTAEALQRIDVPFCLDDFGAGTADVRLLRTLGADIVKLDGSYIAGMTQGGRGRSFVAGMIDIAVAAGALVVAERVETAAEAEALRSLGAHYGQGWLFGRPGPLPGAAKPRPAVRRQGAKESWG